MNIGTKIRYLIEEKNITQRQLADALHISASALNGYINKGKEPDYHTLAGLALYFHTSTDYLLGLSNIRTSSPVPVTQSEGEFLGLYRTLPEYEQSLLRAETKAILKLKCR